MISQLFSDLRPHHAESLAAFVARSAADETVRAVILGGSLVKGTARPDSDVDLIVCVTDERYDALAAAAALVAIERDGITYDGGYYDIKYVSRAILELSAERASEPTRNAYVNARVVHARDPELAAIVARIGVYPVHEQAQRIATFHAGLLLNRGYFWREAGKRGDRYLRARAAADAVMYGLRMVLAHNRVLFPCHKWLTKAVGDCAEAPNDILKLADRLLMNLGNDDMTAFSDAVLSWRDWQIEGDVLSRYVRDHEQWWQFGGPFVSEM
ncbi:MAG TPA: nucleotidyltransferase domain-containing protein [Capsulimonadaceae bacterium]|jgi:predicted nucleotidyltransferase